MIGTWNGIKTNVTARNRTKSNMPWVLVEFIWRRKHHGDLWGGLLKCLREVTFSNVSTNPPIYTEDTSPFVAEEPESDQEVEDSTDEEDEEEDDEDDEDYVE